MSNTGRTDKDFDCVQMKHQIQETIHKQTENMSAAELAEYYETNLSVGPLASWRKALIAKKNELDNAA